MSEDMNKNQQESVKETKKGLFGRKKSADKKDIYQEEQIKSPIRTIMETYASNKLSMAALILFVGIFLFMMIAPYIFKIDLAYNEPLQANLPPTQNFMAYPDSVKSGARSISVGPTFGVAADKNGEFQIWGNTKIYTMPDMIKTKPKGMKDLVKVAAGYDHVLALDSQGKVWAWGSRRQRATSIPPEVKSAKVVDIVAGYQISLAILEDGTTKAWGNTMNFDYYDTHDYQGQVQKVALSNKVATALLKDGSLAYLGTQNNSFSKPPEGKFLDVAGIGNAFAAIKEDGSIVDWGITTYREEEIPKMEPKPVKIAGGTSHFMVMKEDGSVEGFGDNTLFQANAPVGLKDVKEIQSGYYQNYAIKNDGSVESFGLKGYLMGTDDFGRDIFARLVNGGRLTMTIGILAVVISTLIGVLMGGISGYFGGRVDIFIQRVGEIVASFPFLPTIILLNSIFGRLFTSTQKVYLIMVILGLLSWTSLMHLIRAQVFSLREQEFVTAARALGLKEGRIVFQHIIPNVISVIIVSATLSFAGMMLTESALSYLGFGVAPPVPTWGNMLQGANNSTIIQNFWWRWVFPAAILSITIICINLIGTGLDDAIDPKSQGR